MKEFLGIDLTKTAQEENLDLNKLCDLEKAQNVVRLHIIEKHMQGGVIFKNLEGIYIDDSVQIGAGTVICGDQHLRGRPRPMVSSPRGAGRRGRRRGR